MRLATFLFFFSPAVLGFAQTSSNSALYAQVTFYSNDNAWLGGLPGHKPAAFRGRIFDEDHQLAFMEPGHFITFNLKPGTHVFSATPWTTEHAKNGAHITVDLEDGEHYFLQTIVLTTPLGDSRIFINKVVCEGASQEAANSKPLEPAHLRPDGAPLAVTETTFPPCS